MMSVSGIGLSAYACMECRVDDQAAKKCSDCGLLVHKGCLSPHQSKCRQIRKAMSNEGKNLDVRKIFASFQEKNLLADAEGANIVVVTCPNRIYHFGGKKNSAGFQDAWQASVNTYVSRLKERVTSIVQQYQDLNFLFLVVMVGDYDSYTHAKDLGIIVLHQDAKIQSPKEEGCSLM